MAARNESRIDTVERRVRTLWTISRDTSGVVTGMPAATQAGPGIPFYDPYTQETLTDCLLILGLSYQTATPAQVERIRPLYVDLIEHMLNEYKRQGPTRRSRRRSTTRGRTSSQWRSSV